MKEILAKAKKELPQNVSNTIQVFLHRNNKIFRIYGYSSCRGYVHDYLQSKLGNKGPGRANYVYLYYNGKAGVYGKGNHKMSTKTVKLMSEMLGRMGYPPLKFLLSKKGHHMLVALPIGMFNNIYAVSAMFLLHKYPNIVGRESVTNLGEFFGNMSYGGKSMKVISHWQKIFPEKSKWGELYGAGKGLHGEGFGELVNGNPCFMTIRTNVNKVLKDATL